ncbi:hypothetical protein BC828DRAFT_402993 [Blastocladiella britannica]|nr:hypothetical protein BC828DRAFT_402993 [Blastocladiella britannica]
MGRGKIARDPSPAAAPDKFDHRHHHRPHPRHHPYLKIVDGKLDGTPNSDDFKIAYDASRAMLAIVDYCSANTFHKESPELLAKEEAEKAARALKPKKAKKAKDAREARAAAKASEVDEQVAVEDPQAVIVTIAVLAAMDAKKSVRELPAKRMKELAAKRLEAAKRQGLVDKLVLSRLVGGTAAIGWAGAGFCLHNQQFGLGGHLPAVFQDGEVEACAVGPPGLESALVNGEWS